MSAETDKIRDTFADQLASFDDRLEATANDVDMLADIHNKIATLMVADNNVEQIVLAKPTAAYDLKWGNAFIKPDTFVRMLVDSITRDTLR